MYTFICWIPFQRLIFEFKHPKYDFDRRTSATVSTKLA